MDDVIRIEVAHELPVITATEAASDYADRARRHARHCVQLAVVTSSPLAAELIDQAINHFEIGSVQPGHAAP